MDFIVKLLRSKKPLTKTLYDSILVIVDKFTKFSYFVPYKEGSTVEKMAYTFFKIVISSYGLPERIITDRNKLFTSKFWTALIKQLGTDYRKSTTYYPETDGQTERTN